MYHLSDYFSGEDFFCICRVCCREADNPYVFRLPQAESIPLEQNEGKRVSKEIKKNCPTL